MKKILKKLINLFGYEINKSRGQRINMRQSLLHLKENGYTPKLIVDVGVADGTPEIYEIFPESKFLLVEPLDYFQKSINKIIKTYDATHIKVAAGSSSGIKKFMISENKHSNSSFYSGKLDRKEVSVKVDTLDNIVDGYSIDDLSILKIDVEGAELDVLKGGNESIKRFDFIILELTFTGFLNNASKPAEIINHMSKNNFEMIDIFNLRNNHENDLSQGDFLFKNCHDSAITN
tara:strand:+ start:1312 stop:2010 length:699 start_codon:yes stop_codon:yes gene_type:complete